MAVDVQVGDEWVVVRFTGLERLLSLKHGVEVPVAAITGAHVRPVDELRAGTTWKVFGSRVPGLVTAGSFAWDDHPGGRQLWCVERDDEVLVVDVDAAACELPYGRLVLQHPDRHDLAWWIGERVAS